MNRIAIPAALALALAASAAARAQHLVLPPPSPADLAVTGDLVAAAPVVDADREPVAVAWPLAAGSPLRSAAPPFVAASREHWFRVTAAELEGGVDPAIASHGALVRLSPIVSDRNAAAPAPPSLEDVVIVDGAGEPHRGAAAIETLADDEALAAAGAELPDGSAAIRLRPELGAGPFRLRLDGAATSGASAYLIHVFEPESEVVLTLGADRSAYAADSTGEIALAIEDAGGRLSPVEIVGFVHSPGGAVAPLDFVPGLEGRLRASFPTRGEDARAGLWQAEVAVVAAARDAAFDDGDDEPGRRRQRPRGKPRLHRRTARTAFAVALPTARLVGAVEVSGTPTATGLAVAVPVEVAIAGRYAVRGTVAAKRADGSRLAVARAESAAWLEPGEGELALELPAQVLATAAPGSELELVELELVDPGRLGLLERRALELSLGTRP